MDDPVADPAGLGGVGAGAPRYLILFFGALAALGPLSMDAYLPAVPAMAADFGVTVVSLQNTLSVFLIGYACGQFFGGSFSDQIGRKRIGYAGLGVYIVASLAIAFARSVDEMLVLRFVQAIGGGFSTVICMATVRDAYPIEQLGRRFATVTMIVLVAPLVAPVIGTFLLPFGWAKIFLLKAIYAAFLLGAYAAFVPETRPGHWASVSIGSIFRQCREVVTRRIDGRALPIRYACSMALASSCLMVFVTNASFIYMEHFGVAPAQFPWLFGLSVLGFMSVNLFSMRRLGPHNAAFYFRCGLSIQLAAVVALAVVVATGSDSLWSVVPLIVVIMSMLGLVGPAGSARYMAFFDELAGSASSVYTTLMFSLGGLLGTLTGVLNDATLSPIVGVMLCAALTANAIGLGLPARGAAAPA
jgi:DHA1 family bicyclomycin/chloramphenicol resistance-like MFS transporter